MFLVHWFNEESGDDEIFWKLKLNKVDFEGIKMKEWWQDFFIPVTGEIMFQPRKEQSVLEVNQVAKQTELILNR